MTNATQPRPFAYLPEEAFAKLSKEEKIAYLARAIEALVREAPASPPENKAPEARPASRPAPRPQPREALHPAIQRLVNLAPRIRMKAPFRLKAAGSRVEGVTTHDYTPTKKFSADFATTPPTWKSNDDEFWKGVMAVLLHPDGDERTLAHFLSPKTNATAPPPPREEPPAPPPAPATRAEEAPSPPPPPPSFSALDERPPAPLRASRREERAPGRPAPERGSRIGLVVLFLTILGVAAYGAHRVLDSTPGAEVQPPPVAQAPEPSPAKPAPPAAEAPQPAQDAQGSDAAAVGASAPAQAAAEASATCYKDGDRLTIRGTASKLAEGRRLKDVWVFTAASPICVAQGPNSETMISTLQLVGKPPPADVPLELTGELVTSNDSRFALEHRILVKQGRRLQ